MNAGKGLLLGTIFLCGVALASPLRAQSPAQQGAFNGRLVEDATTVNGQTCANAAVGFSYSFPGGTRVEDGRAMRIEESHVDLEARGIQPEAGYFLWGYGESKSVARVCAGEGRALKIEILAFPKEELGRFGPNPVQRLSDTLAQRAGLHRGNQTTFSDAGHSFQSSVYEGTTRFGGQSEKVFVAIYGTPVNSYYVMWEVSGKQANVLKQMKDSLASLKVTAPAPLKPKVAASTSTTGIAQDFQSRLKAFMNAWLTKRSEGKTFSFVDRSAFKAPPIIGSYCGGWYKPGMTTKNVKSYIVSNVMGVPSSFPKGTAAAKIFSAWTMLPPEWLNEAANDPAKDHFLVVEVNEKTLPLLFRNRFANSAYSQYLSRQIAKAGSLYWVVFPEIIPDGDIFVIFTTWEKIRSTWSITGFDVVCQ